jgi:membrane protein implicated in regulation of membrane protease activity
MTDLIVNNLPWFWVTVMLACIVIESLTFSLTTIWFACGALFTIFVSMTPLAFRWQLLFFTVVSFILLVITRPLVVKKIAAKKQLRTNSDALIGKEVPLIKAVTPFDKGEIRYNGTLWSAQSTDGTAIAKNTVCRITGIQGNTILVISLENTVSAQSGREKNK